MAPHPPSSVPRPSIRGMQDAIAHRAREAGQLPPADSLRPAHLAGGSVEQLLHLVRIPVGSPRTDGEPMELHDVRAAVVRQGLGDQVTGFLKAEVRHVEQTSASRG